MRGRILFPVIYGAFDTIDGVSIAEAVTSLVNMTAGKILEET